MTATKTIAETISEIREALRNYIEATYHIGHPSLVAQRHALLEEEGVLFRAPYIESTPRYKASRSFADLDIPQTAKTLFTSLAHPPQGQSSLLYDPPYTHQATALEATTRDGMSLVITTGTGSGKTESFLLPILAKLAIEAQGRPDSFEVPALRALLLYPMNALVNDQLGRLRILIGDPRVSAQIHGVERPTGPLRPIHQPNALPRGTHGQEGHRAPQIDRDFLYRPARRSRRS